MKRKAAFMAVVVLLLAYDTHAQNNTQPPDWLFSGGADLSASNAQIWSESKGHPKIASRLTQAASMAPLLAQPSLTPVPLTESLSGFARFDQQGRVEVYITLDHVNESTLNALRGAGVEIEIYDASQRLVQGWIASPQVQAAADLPAVTFVDLPNYGMTNAGSIMTQGDSAIRADQARALTGATGSGVKVGVLSGGISGLTDSIASGDLPASGVTMPAAPLTGGGISLDSPLPGGTVFTSTPVGRSDLTTYQSSSNSEGTAMLEIIHDIAPDAQLFFAPAGTTLADQRAIRWLKSQGVKVIADDHLFLNVGPNDGTSAISQEASNAVADRISYFVAVGNQAQQHYRGLFTDTDGDTFHEFDVSLGLPRVDNAGETLNVTLQPFETVIILLQWNDPFGGSTNNYDLCVHYPAADILTSPFRCSMDLQTGTQNPTEGIGLINSGSTPVTLGVSIHRVGGAAPRVLDLFIIGGVMNEFVVPWGSVPNKSDAGGGVISVGAVNWQTPNEIEFFSSRGPTSDGRVKPELVAPDGVATSVAGFTSFFGTSAAAPHAAGAAALILSANPTFTPAQLSARLTQAAVPLGSPVPNNTFGFGRIDTLQALSVTPTPTPTLRDAVYLYGQPLDGKGDKVLVGVDCEVFQLVLDVTSGYTNLAMGQGSTLANALGTQSPYADTINSTDAMFAYALYRDQPVKSFMFKDWANPSSSAQMGTATAFGYCYSTKPTAHVYFQQQDICTNTYSDGHTTSCAVADNGSGVGSGGSGDVSLRDAIYLYGQALNGKGDKILAGEHCDVFQLILDVTAGYTDLAMGQSSTLNNALAAQVAYPDRILDSAAMFSYALYDTHAVKAFVFHDQTNPTSSLPIGTATAFGYCYSTNPAARVYLRELDTCTDKTSTGQISVIPGC